MLTLESVGPLHGASKEMKSLCSGEFSSTPKVNPIIYQENGVADVDFAVCFTCG